jgi:hypothetical protein
MSFDKWFILVVIISAVNVTGRGLDAAKSPVVSGVDKSLKGNKKSGLLRPLFAKRRRRKGNLSGKAMHDAVPACAKTHGLKKSQFLEEG